jgi:hypothetical protein
LWTYVSSLINFKGLKLLRHDIISNISPVYKLFWSNNSLAERCSDCCGSLITWSPFVYTYIHMRYMIPTVWRIYNLMFLKCLILLVKITLMLIWNSPHNTFNKQVVLKTENLDNLMWFFCNQHRNINRGLWAAENLTSGMLVTTRNLLLLRVVQK